MTVDRWGKTLYDPDDEPVWCPHGVQIDAPLWCRATCHECETDACEATGHVYAGDVLDADGNDIGVCECGQETFPYDPGAV